MTETIEIDGVELDPNAHYLVRGCRGVAFWLDGAETRPDEDTEWSGCESPTGRVLMVMVGDDHRHSVDPADLTVLDELDYCAECGQVGCSHDGRERS